MTNRARNRCAQRRSWCSGLTLPQASTLSPTTEAESVSAVEFVHRLVPIPPTKLIGIRTGKTTHAMGMKMTRRVFRYLMKKYASKPHLLMIARSGTAIRPVTRAHGARGGGSLHKVSAGTFSRQVDRLKICHGRNSRPLPFWDQEGFRFVYPCKLVPQQEE